MSKLRDAIKKYGQAVDGQGWEVPELETAVTEIHTLLLQEYNSALREIMETRKMAVSDLAQAFKKRIEQL